MVELWVEVRLEFVATNTTERWPMTGRERAESSEGPWGRRIKSDTSRDLSASGATTVKPRSVVMEHRLLPYRNIPERGCDSQA